MNLFNKMFGRQKPRRASHPLAVAPQPAWLMSDVLAVRAFLNSVAGQKLMQRARAMEYNRAVTNARDTFHSKHSAGVTVGIADTLNWIQSLASYEMIQKLSVPTAAQPENKDTADREQDDAALVEKFSP